MKPNYKISKALSQRITAEQAFHYRIVPKQLDNDTLIFKTDTDNLEGLLMELKIVMGYPLDLEKVTTQELQDYLTSNYRIANAGEKSILSYSVDFLDKILITAKDIGSSDIHFECFIC